MLPPPLVMRPGPSGALQPWSYAPGIPAGRVRPERASRLSWEDADYWAAPSGRLASLAVADLSPRLAARRLLLLFERAQFREAAALLGRLGRSTFGAIVPELPVDVLLDAMPQSLPVFEALFARAGGPAAGALRPDAVVMRVVKHFARHDDVAVAPVGAAACRQVLRGVAAAEPGARLRLLSRRRRLEKAIEGLGQHGLVGTSEESLATLHDALRLELEKAVQGFRTALQKLDEMGAAPLPRGGSVRARTAPVRASHQRQLSLKQHEIQERLIRNKTLLDAMAPCLETRAPDVLLGILRRRIEFDKDALFQFTQLKREARDVNPDSIVAPVLMRFSHGCAMALRFMRDNADSEDEDDSSDISGYHSDSDSAVMMSGNSPYISKSARYNFLYRSIRSNSRTSGSRSPGSTSDCRELENKSDPSRARTKYKKSDCHVSTGPNGALPKGSPSRVCLEDLPSPVFDMEMSDMKKEIEVLRCDLMKARQTIVGLQDREKKMKDRLAEQAQRMVERGGGSGAFENVAFGDKRPTVLIRRYGNLYAQARVDTLDALDGLPELHDAEELKSKLLFSVVVLAFRSVHSSVQDMRDTLRRILQIPDIPGDAHATEVEAGISLYLKKTIDRYDVKKNVEEVCSQIWATLYDYPCLKACEGLIQYIRDCVKLAWGLCNQTPPFCIEYETRLFRRDMHVRFHSSNQDSEQIKTYLWPALLERDKGPCVHKGVVVTKISGYHGTAILRRLQEVQCYG